jgi:hypothetical protein
MRPEHAITLTRVVMLVRPTSMRVAPRFRTDLPDAQVVIFVGVRFCPET